MAKFKITNLNTRTLLILTIVVATCSLAFSQRTDAILMMALWDRSNEVLHAAPVKISTGSILRHEGAIIRADRSVNKLALVFTGDEFAEGATAIADALKDRDVRGSFFLTGRFYRNPAFKSVIQRLKTEGHYLGPHSNDRERE